MAASQPPSSPPKKSHFLRELITGVQPVDTITHQQRWGKRPPATDEPRRRDAGAPRLGLDVQQVPPPKSSNGHVASMVQGFEAASLSSSRPYSSHPPAPSPQSIPLPPSPTKSRTSAQGPSGSSPSVPASFFQQQQARRTPPTSPSSGKENRALLPPISRTSSASPEPPSPSTRSQFSSTKPRDRQSERVSTSGPSSEVDVAGASNGSEVSYGSSSAGGASTAFSCEGAFVGHATVETVAVSKPSRIFVGAAPALGEGGLGGGARVTERPQPARPRPQPQAAVLPPQLQSRGSSFIEALPASCPSRQSPPLVSVPFANLAPAPTEYRPQPHQQYPARPVPKSYAPLPLDERVPPPVAKDVARSRSRSATIGGERGAKEKPQVDLRFESLRDKQSRIERQFEQLLDKMQLPSRSVREKMMGVSLSLKEQMLTSTTTSPSRPGHSRGVSLNASVGPVSASNLPLLGSAQAKPDKSRPFLRKSKSSTSLAADVGGLLRSLGRSSGATAATASAGFGAEEDATWWAVRVRSTSCAALEVKEVGRLRGRLRAEAPAWVEEFVKHGGYTGLLERLKELLDIEWREEQHGDQILHEILRCFKALTLTACGKRALASRSPTPFVALSSLLFSEKRPGDLPCRQILVELIHSLFDICPPNVGPITKEEWAATSIAIQGENAVAMVQATGSESGGARRYLRKAKGGEGGEEDKADPERMRKVHEMVLSLVMGPPDEKHAAKVEFAQEMVRPRRLKTWVSEISDTVRDFFWVFCHSQNQFWTAEQLNSEEIEAPKVPSGMTGGVEFEAMSYCTTHFRLINMIAKTCPTPAAAHEFHHQLFESGFEHVIFTLRRASTTFYQSLHLEMARYISLARSVEFLLPPRVLGAMEPRFLVLEERRALDAFQRRHAGGGRPVLPTPAFS